MACVLRNGNEPAAANEEASSKRDGVPLQGGQPVIQGSELDLWHESLYDGRNSARAT